MSYKTYFVSYNVIEYKANTIIIIFNILSMWIKDIHGYCHGAHSREEQEHADEDLNSNIQSLMETSRQGKTRQGKADMDRNTGE